MELSKITSQKAAPQGLKTNIMTNKITHARSGNISDKNKDVIEGVELKIKIAKPYYEELCYVKNEDEAVLWAQSIPNGIERTLLFLIALNRL